MCTRHNVTTKSRKNNRIMGKYKYVIEQQFYEINLDFARICCKIGISFRISEKNAIKNDFRNTWLINRNTCKYEDFDRIVKQFNSYNDEKAHFYLNNLNTYYYKLDDELSKTVTDKPFEVCHSNSQKDLIEFISRNRLYTDRYHITYAEKRCHKEDIFGKEDISYELRDLVDEEEEHRPKPWEDLGYAVNGYFLLHKKEGVKYFVKEDYMPGNCYRIDSSDTCYNTSGHYSIFCFSEDGVDYSDQFTKNEPSIYFHSRLQKRYDSYLIDISEDAQNKDLLYCIVCRDNDVLFCFIEPFYVRGIDIDTTRDELKHKAEIRAIDHIAKWFKDKFLWNRTTFNRNFTL